MDPQAGEVGPQALLQLPADARLQRLAAAGPPFDAAAHAVFLGAGLRGAINCAPPQQALDRLVPVLALQV